MNRAMADLGMKLENVVVEKSRVRKARETVMMTMNAKGTLFVVAIIVAKNSVGIQLTVVKRKVILNRALSFISIFISC